METGTLHRHRSGQRGVSLVELMVALLLGMKLMIALVVTFSSVSQARRELDRSVELHESGRYALNYLHKELSQAGFFGAMLVDRNLSHLNLDLPCITLDSEWAQSLAIHVRGRNQDDTSSLFDCIAGLRKPGTDAVFTQRVSTCIADTVDCTEPTAGRAYLQVSLCGSEFATRPFVLATLPLEGVTSPFELMGKDCLPGQPAPLRAYIRRIFYISTADELSYVDILPGLVSAPVVVTAGVDNLQIEYAIDRNADGVPDAFSHEPMSTDWRDVIGAHLWVLARAETESPETQGTVFTLGDVTVSPSDRFKRHLFSTYLAFITPQSSREQ